MYIQYEYNGVGVYDTLLFGRVRCVCGCCSASVQYTRSHRHVAKDELDRDGRGEPRHDLHERGRDERRALLLGGPRGPGARQLAAGLEDHRLARCSSRALSSSCCYCSFVYEYVYAIRLVTLSNLWNLVGALMLRGYDKTRRCT